jgi:Pentapeptide repeats (8 copies)
MNNRGSASHSSLIHHPRYTVSHAASGKERKAEMTDSKPPSNSEERQDKKWYDRTRYQVLLFAVVIVLFVIVGALVLDWYIDPQTSTQRKDLAQALGLLTAGVAGAGVIFFTWRGQRLTREAQGVTQKNTQKQLEQARLGQITERFTRAIDQLGATEEGKKNLEVRLGGIYSLERTAHDDQDYHRPIMEVLATYVRRHAARKPGKESKDNAATPEPDIQAILEVIGRRSKPHRINEEVEYGTIELNNTDLQGANLKGAYLKRANLQGADLREANLLGAIVTDEQLVTTRKLEDATMPDGSKHP